VQSLKEKQEQTGEKILIPYFYIGDLIDIALDNVNRDRPTDKEIIRLITGPVIFNKNLVNLTSANRKSELNLLGKEDLMAINIADIPISFRQFFDWFYLKLNSNQQFEYTFMELINDICKEILPTMLTPWAFGRRYVGGRIDFTSHILTGQPEGDSDPITKRPFTTFGGSANGKDPTIEELSNLLSDSPKDPENPGKVLQYLYIQGRYVDQTQTARYVDEIADAQDNIYHLKVGAYNGLVKNINFTREENPSISVENYINEGRLNPGFFRTSYRSTVDMIGNTVFKPGMTVFIDPSFMLTNTTSDAAEAMGLSSYHMILKTATSIGAGGYRTTLSTKSTVMGTRNKSK
jgi:hypothetical protein